MVPAPGPEGTIIVSLVGAGVTHSGKVFGVGFPRAGTSSLVQALEILGIKSVHNPVALLTDLNHPLLESFDGFADNPLPLIYPKLDAQFPGRKFILTDRDVDGWLTSVRWMFDAGRKYGNWDANARTVAMHRALYGSVEFEETRFRSRFLRHRDEVLAYFADRAEDLLVMDLSRSAGWEALCGFLGRAVPKVSFPHDNRRELPFSLKSLRWRLRYAWRRFRADG